MSTVGEGCPTKILRSHVGAQTACNRGACSDTWLSLLLACQSTSSCLGGMKCWIVLESCEFLSTQVPTTMSQVLLKVKTWFSLEILKHSESHVSGVEKVRGKVYYRDIPWSTLLTVAFLLQQSEGCISVAAQHGQATFTIKSTVLFRKALIRSICLEIHLPRHNGQVGTSLTYKWPSIKINGLKIAVNWILPFPTPKDLESKYHESTLNQPSRFCSNRQTLMNNTSSTGHGHGQSTRKRCP